MPTGGPLIGAAEGRSQLPSGAPARASLFRPHRRLAGSTKRARGLATWAPALRGRVREERPHREPWSEIDSMPAVKKTAPESRRNSQLGAVAQGKILPMSRPGDIGNAVIGHPLFFPGERIISQASETRQIGKRNEAVFVTETAMSVGSTEGGRVLLSYDANCYVTYGGFFWIRQGRRRCVQSIYVATEYRPFHLGSWLAKLAKSRHVTCALEPISEDGRRWAMRNGIDIRPEK